MAEKINLELVLKSAEAAASVKEVKDALKGIKNAMLQVGDESPAEFHKLATAAADVNAASRFFSPVFLFNNT